MHFWGITTLRCVGAKMKSLLKKEEAHSLPAEIQTSREEFKKKYLLSLLLVGEVVVLGLRHFLKFFILYLVVTQIKNILLPQSRSKV